MKNKYLLAIFTRKFHCNIAFRRCRVLSFAEIPKGNQASDRHHPSVAAGNQATFFRIIRRPSVIFYALLCSLVQSSIVFGHRGPIDEIDTCRIPVGSEWIHFTAYTPTFTEGKEYCQSIPQLGPTSLVFDYEGKKLRHVTVEFEVTKEPEGTQIFYQKPKKIKTGTVDSLVDFSKFGAGAYLAHVTIVDKGDKLDAHLPFSVGIADDSSSVWIKYLPQFLTGIGIFLVLFFLMWSTRRKSDRVISTTHTEFRIRLMTIMALVMARIEEFHRIPL